MDIVKMFLFLGVMILLPYFTGTGVWHIIEKKKANEVCTLEKWNMGMVFMYAVFEVWALIATFGRISLKKTTVLYAGTLFLAILIGYIIKFREKSSCKVLQKKEKKVISDFYHQNPWTIVLIVFVIAGILYQMIYVCVNMHMDDDDAYYVGMAVTSYFSNTISANHPYTGTPADLKLMANYVLSPYPIFWAMWSKILGLHPAILMRSILPAVNIAWCYAIYYLLAKVVFKNTMQRMEFMFIVVLTNLFGACSNITSSMFLLTRVWQGKGTIAAICMPLLWYLWIRLRREKHRSVLWFLMAFSVMGTCLCSSMALFLCPILLGSFGLEYLIEKKDWKSIGKLILCVLPCLALALCELYLVYR